VRQTFPSVKIYASPALSAALDGFLAGYADQLKQAIASNTQSSEQQQGFRDELALIEAGQKLAPDEILSQSGKRKISGRGIAINLEAHSVTAGDIWILDPSSGTLVAGDLVTLPFPFFDTACPSRWKESLDRLASAKFERLVPGHGAPMTRSAFELYRKAFAGLLTCAASDRSPEVCTEGWLRDAGAEKDQKLARVLAGYYMENSLRAAPDQRAKLCGE